MELSTILNMVNPYFLKYLVLDNCICPQLDSFEYIEFLSLCMVVGFSAEKIKK